MKTSMLSQKWGRKPTPRVRKMARLHKRVRKARRVKVICATEAMAAERGRYLRNALANNVRVRCVFPRLQPAQPWEVTRFTITRPAEALGPSVTCLGVGCGATGSRADLQAGHA